MTIPLKSWLILTATASLGLIGNITILSSSSIAQPSRVYCQEYAEDYARQKSGGVIKGAARGAIIE